MSDAQTIVLSGGTVITGGAAPAVIDDGAVAWSGGRIAQVGPAAEVTAAHPGAERLDARGGLILPGLVNVHHHFYSALARGLDPGPGLDDFGQVLDRLWWRLDRALDAETVRLSALISVAACIQSGCTTVFDHHASPSCLAGSLDAIAEAVRAGGLRGALCYEVTDRNGPAEARAGIAENARFAQSVAGEPRLAGLLGLHASFTLRDETLAAAAEASDSCHIHVAEDPLDVEETRRAFGVGPVERLARFGLLGERSILAHGIHLGPDALSRAGAAGAILVQNPESNANNGVGRLELDRAQASGLLVALGTDGMSSAMLRSLRFSFLGDRGGHEDPTRGFAQHPQLLWNNVRVARRFFDEPLLGELVPDAPADLVVVDAPPPTPIHAGNIFGHLVYGASEAPVRHTIAAGRVLLRDFQLTGFDLQEISGRARRAAPALWERFAALSPGTPYRGE